MARNKRLPASTSRIFTNPQEAARHIKALRAAGAQIQGTRAAMAAIGVQPHHYTDEETLGLPEPESILLSRQARRAQPNPDETYSPTATSNPANPRTSAASYYSTTQTLVIEWGDGGVPYAYYDVPPQIWQAFRDADSPGRFINAVLNGYAYGPIGPRYENNQRTTDW